MDVPVGEPGRCGLIDRSNADDEQEEVTVASDSTRVEQQALKITCLYSPLETNH
jgi:hypothetical protein